jgi:hypothetical protein
VSAIGLGCEYRTSACGLRRHQIARALLTHKADKLVWYRGWFTVQFSAKRGVLVRLRSGL